LTYREIGKQVLVFAVVTVLTAAFLRHFFPKLGLMAQGAIISASVHVLLKLAVGGYALWRLAVRKKR
jgi:hypothetical protein